MQIIALKTDATPNSVFSQLKPVTMMEMKPFLALTLSMGLIWKPEIKQYWSTDPVAGTAFWGSYMVRDRYLAIMTFFHAAGNATRNPDEPDKLFKVHPLFDYMVELFKMAYSHKQELSVEDQSMVCWTL